MTRLTQRSLIPLAAWSSFAVAAALAGCGKKEEAKPAEAPAAAAPAAAPAAPAKAASAAKS